MNYFLFVEGSYASCYRKTHGTYVVEGPFRTYEVTQILAVQVLLKPERTIDT